MEWVDYLALVSSIITVGLNIIPGQLLIALCKGNQVYSNIPLTMIIFNILNTIGWGSYWFRKEEILPTLCSVTCALISTLFGIIYFYFMAEKKIYYFFIYVLFQLGVEYGLTFAFLKVIENINILGIFSIFTNIVMSIAPIKFIIAVIKNKIYKLIPIYTTLACIICSGGWIMFSFYKSDIIFLISNSLNVCQSVTTLIVRGCLVYCSKKNEEKEKEETEELKEVDEEKK